MPYLAIGFFAGLRPAELQGLTWADVDLKSKLIRVMPEVAKTRRARSVEITPNLAKWLRRYRHQNGAAVVPPYVTMRRWRRKVGLACGLGTWPQDVMRHCFATYYLETHDVQSTIRQLGHTSPTVLYDNYRGLTTRKEAEKFWRIIPRVGAAR